MIRYTFNWLWHGRPVKYGDTFTVPASWYVKRKHRKETVRDFKARQATALRRSG